jgi:hypothetical protein
MNPGIVFSFQRRVRASITEHIVVDHFYTREAIGKIGKRQAVDFAFIEPFGTLFA